MIVASPLLYLLLLYSTPVYPFRSLARTQYDSDNAEKLERLRDFFEERNAAQQEFLPRLFRRYDTENGERRRYGVREREADVPVSSLYGGDQRMNVIDPDDDEIDAVVGQIHQSVDQIPPKSRSQLESVPVVVQKTSDNLQKQTRAPLNKPIAAQFVQDSSVKKQSEKTSDIYFVALVAGCSGAAVFGVVAAGFCWYKLQKNAKAAAAADYPAYGVTGPSKEQDMTSPPSGDRKLAQNAQMFHYQHQKQQMIAIEKASSDRHVSTSDLDSEEENEEGDYTVYECPGLAPTGEMEVKNPLFQDDPAPATPPPSAKGVEK